MLIRISLERGETDSVEEYRIFQYAKEENGIQNTTGELNIDKKNPHILSILALRKTEDRWVQCR